MINALSYLLQAYVIIGLLILGLTIFSNKDEFLAGWDSLQDTEGRADGNIMMFIALFAFVLTWPLVFTKLGK